MLSAEENTAFWALKNGCEPRPTVSELPDTEADDTKVKRIEYAGCRGDSNVTLYSVTGGGTLGRGDGSISRSFSWDERAES